MNIKRPTPTDTVIHGDCTIALKDLNRDTIDFVLTDPPYAINYQDRSGRTISNDLDPRTIIDGFREVGRILKPNRLCVAFYGWQHVDAFAAAWKAGNLAPVGHIVFSKEYTSGQRFLRYSHECAYLLAKGQT